MDLGPQYTLHLESTKNNSGNVRYCSLIIKLTKAYQKIKYATKLLFQKYSLYYTSLFTAAITSKHRLKSSYILLSQSGCWVVVIAVKHHCHTFCAITETLLLRGSDQLSYQSVSPRWAPGDKKHPCPIRIRRTVDARLRIQAES